MKINIIHEQCDPDLAKDTSLPYTAYLIEYKNGENICYDIAVSSKKVDIFDYYYDKYKNLQALDWTNGTVNPKLYGYKPTEEKKKKR